MCWPVKRDDPLRGCLRQRVLLESEYGTVVLRTATAYASRLPQPVCHRDKLACLSVAQKYVEDEPISRLDLFPGLSHEELRRAEWRVLEQLEYRLRD